MHMKKKAITVILFIISLLLAACGSKAPKPAEGYDIVLVTDAPNQIQTRARWKQLRQRREKPQQYRRQNFIPDLAFVTSYVLKADITDFPPSIPKA